MKQETTTQRRRPRGLRNNPGNLRRTGDRWQGLRPVQDDPEFLQFEAPCWGYPRGRLNTRPGARSGQAPATAPAGPKNERRNDQ